MLLNEYQENAQKYAVATSHEHEPVFGLLEEAGEVAGKFKRLGRGDYLKRIEVLADVGEGPTPFSEFDRQMEAHSLFRRDLIKELGDVMWYIARIAKLHNISLEEIAQTNLDKLEDRLQRNLIQGSGDHR